MSRIYDHVFRKRIQLVVDRMQKREPVTCRKICPAYAQSEESVSCKHLSVCGKADPAGCMARCLDNAELGFSQSDYVTFLQELARLRASVDPGSQKLQFFLRTGKFDR